MEDIDISSWGHNSYSGFLQMYASIYVESLRFFPRNTKFSIYHSIETFYVEYIKVCSNYDRHCHIVPTLEVQRFIEKTLSEFFFTRWYVLFLTVELVVSCSFISNVCLISVETAVRCTRLKWAIEVTQVLVMTHSYRWPQGSFDKC